MASMSKSKTFHHNPYSPTHNQTCIYCQKEDISVIHHYNFPLCSKFKSPYSIINYGTNQIKSHKSHVQQQAPKVAKNLNQTKTDRMQQREIQGYKEDNNTKISSITISKQEKLNNRDENFSTNLIKKQYQEHQHYSTRESQINTTQTCLQQQFINTSESKSKRNNKQQGKNKGLNTCRNISNLHDTVSKNVKLEILTHENVQKHQFEQDLDTATSQKVEKIPSEHEAKQVITQSTNIKSENKRKLKDSSDRLDEKLRILHHNLNNKNYLYETFNDRLNKSHKAVREVWHKSFFLRWQKYFL